MLLVSGFALTVQDGKTCSGFQDDSRATFHRLPVVSTAISWHPGLLIWSTSLSVYKGALLLLQTILPPTTTNPIPRSQTLLQLQPTQVQTLLSSHDPQISSQAARCRPLRSDTSRGPPLLSAASSLFYARLSRPYAPPAFTPVGKARKKPAICADGDKLFPLKPIPSFPLKPQREIVPWTPSGSRGHTQPEDGASSLRPATVGNPCPSGLYSSPLSRTTVTAPLDPVHWQMTQKPRPSLPLERLWGSVWQGTGPPPRQHPSPPR